MMAEMISMIRSFAEPVSWALLHSFWQAGLVALFLAGTIAALKNARAHVRCSLAIAGLAAVFVLFVGTVAYIGVDTGTTADRGTQVQTTQKTPVPSEANIGTVMATSPVTEPGSGGDMLSPLRSYVPWLFSLWLLGVGLMSVYHLAGFRRTLSLLRQGLAPVDQKWQQRLDDLSRQLGIRRAVKLAQSALVKAPCVIGWIKPVVLLPVSALSGLTPDQIEMLLVHELAHVRRLDILVNYLQTVAETLLFYNPAVWWISKQIRVEREHCCDDLVVSFNGDRLRYARALTEMESLKSVKPSMAMAADGRSLADRVRRLAGRPSPSGRNRGVGLAGLVMSVLFLLLTVGSLGTLTPTSAVAGPDDQAQGQYQEQRDDYHGRWESDPYRGGIEFHIEFRSARCNRSFRLYDEEIEEFFTQTETGFVFTTDAGTFYCEGRMEEDGWGDGRCHFQADPDYANELDRLGVDRPDREEQFYLGIHGVSLDFVRGLKEFGYDDFSFDELIKFHIHGVSPEFIRELEELGYRNLDRDMLVKMRIHDANPETIRRYEEMGYGRLDPEQVVKMQIHDVSPDYIEQMKSLGFDRLDPEELVKMRIHDVDPDFIRDMADMGYDHLYADELVKMRIHDVSPYYIRQLSDLGYRDIHHEQLVKMKIHDVDPYFIRELAELGYDDVDTEDLVRMRIHDVTPSFIRRLQEDGYKNLSVDRLVSFKIHGLSRRSRR